MKGLRLSAGRLEERGMKVGTGEREWRKKVEAYTLLHKDAFVQQPAWEKCALCHKTMSFFWLSLHFSMWKTLHKKKKKKSVIFFQADSILCSSDYYTPQDSLSGFPHFWPMNWGLFWDFSNCFKIHCFSKIFWWIIQNEFCSNRIGLTNWTSQWLWLHK